ncbi:MAG: J domain-containing protein [Geminicoccaceae bacterium]|nr:J domain-containing protein [Geminicoccaceae bacterium]
MTTRNARPRLHERLEALRLEETGSKTARHCCDWPGCEETGEFRAPRTRDQLRDFMLLCLDHVREYNLKWNYFEGMSDEEVEEHRRADTTWHRPSWPFASGSFNDIFHDPFDLFREPGTRQQSREQAAWQAAQQPDRTTMDMMSRLGLREGFSEDELKRRYKVLAKANHPDLNPGDARAGERLRAIIEAYQYLRDL